MRLGQLESGDTSRISSLGHRRMNRALRAYLWLVRSELVSPEVSTLLPPDPRSFCCVCYSTYVPTGRQHLVLVVLGAAAAVAGARPLKSSNKAQLPLKPVEALRKVGRSRCNVAKPLWGPSGLWQGQHLHLTPHRRPPKTGC